MFSRLLRRRKTPSAASPIPVSASENGSGAGAAAAPKNVLPTGSKLLTKVVLPFVKLRLLMLPAWLFRA